MAERRYYHTVRGRRKACRLWLPPDSDAYWHMCGDPEEVVALTIPTRGGPLVLDVKDRAHADKIEMVMKELKERAKFGNIGRGDFDEVPVMGRGRDDEQIYTDDSVRAIDYLLLDLGIEPRSKELEAMRDYAHYEVQRAAGPRGGRPRRSRWEGETPPWLARRVKVHGYRRRKVHGYRRRKR